MIGYPCAKINIGLFVTGKREDGYHNLESVFYPVPLKDILEIETGRSDNLECTVTGKVIENQELGVNTCQIAWQILHKLYGIPPVQMALHKQIPTGAGMGGGSSDGAFALKMLSEFFRLELSESELEDLSLQIGSDCPFFIKNRPCLVKGRGEILSGLAEDVLKGKYIVLLNPGIHISTAEAYKNIILHQPEFNWQQIWQQPELWKNKLMNSFEPYAIFKYPEIGKLKELLYNSGAFYASMSGSGSTVFGLYHQKPDAEFFPNNVLLMLSVV
jgi:4-diphosphocytidyl-2-C-methyl-D-erythritol kinase